ncbi:F4 family fimbrial subunit [Citrobacter freundii]|uniref:F4 family fimbrial subunit n=1 Tax=Citrobacter freundii TaxID=546 RepID=UPI00383AF5D7
MKKTLIALAVAASAAVSGSALAGLGSFSSSNINNTVNFGGTITPPVVNQWVWAVGQGYDQYSNTTNDLTENGRKLTITASENMPLLVGKSAQAFYGQPGLSPRISFSDASGEVTPVWDNEGLAKGTITIAVNGDNQTRIGSMTLPVTGVGIMLVDDKTGTNPISVMHSRSNAFQGGYGIFNSPPSFSLLNTQYIGAYGGPTVQELVAQVKALKPTAQDPNVDYVVPVDNVGFDHDSQIYSSGYALGIPNGSAMTVTFNNSLSGETAWNAPLTMQISYQ